jgi:quinol monooxygenase YgiN
MSNTVSWVFQLKVKDGEYDNAKALMDEMSAATQADEPGALVYEWFASEDKTTVHVYERYSDSAATMVHLGNFGSKFAERMLAITEPTGFTVFGDPSADVRGVLADFGAVHMAQVAGFAR